MQAGNAEDGMVDPLSFEPTVAEDLPGLHTGKDVLHSGTNLLVKRLRSSFQDGSSSPWRRRCGMTGPVA